MSERTALEVWGDPIAHSLSPALHRAAYAHLGWARTYDRRRVAESAFAATLAGPGAKLRGLSLTYPLKGAAFAASAVRDSAAELTGAVNTMLLIGDRPRGFNTDVGGIVRDLRDHGVNTLEQARIVGAGATSASALVALAELGAATVDVVARRPEAVAPLAAMGERLGVVVRPVPLHGPHDPAPVTVATLPGGAVLPADAVTALAAAGGVLYDVVYGTWPTPLAAAWQAAGATAVAGHGMLLQQAVLQVRIFATGDPGIPLPDEEDVVAVMRRALVEG